MSDSDSDSDYSDISQKMDVPHEGTHKNAVTTIKLPEEVYDQWTDIPIDVKREAAHLLKLCAFWLPILLRHDECSKARWAVEIGLIDSNNREDLSLKHLHRIETLEAILRALEKGILKKDQSKHVILISNKFNLRSPEVLDDALYWLERTGEPSIRARILGFGHPNTCFTALHLIFTEYAQYIQEMGKNMEKTMTQLKGHPGSSHIEKSEEMKEKGNENFQKNQFEVAVKFYSRAIEYYPENHKLYGNRALCYIRCKKYLKAVGDGKRATLIDPVWVKGHYRYCEALFYMGEVKMAIEANKSAQVLCKADQEGIKDLEQQNLKFKEMAKAKPIKKGQTKRSECTNSRADAAESQLQSGEAVNVINQVAEAASHSMRREVAMKKPTQQGKKERTSQAEGSTKDSKPSKSEFLSKNGKGDSNPAAKMKSKSRNCPSEHE